MTESTPGRRLVVEADGGSRGNPGVAGYGALVRDAATGAVLAERAEPLGKQSNNVAEYRGLVAGLEAALAIEPGADVHVRMDSKLVIEQMAGRWRIKHEDMRRLALTARDLVRQVVAAGGSVTWEWIPRAENADADRLSNDGMDGLTIHRDLPDDHSVASETVAAGATKTSDVRSEGSVVSETVAAGATKTSDVAGVVQAGPALTGSTRLVLVRHGVTDFTAAGRVDGRGGADPDLNADGLRQAEAAAGAVRELVGDAAARVITSSLNRAAQTGAAIAAALGVAPELDADWDEQSFGDWDGETIAHLDESAPDELRRLREDRDYARPGGESLAQVEERVLAALARATATAGTVVVATSRKPILVVLAHVLHLAPDRFWAISTGPASISAVEFWPDGNVSVPFTNRTGHLG